MCHKFVNRQGNIKQQQQQVNQLITQKEEQETENHDKSGFGINDIWVNIVNTSYESILTPPNMVIVK